MDNITDLQQRQLRYGGNNQFHQFLRLYGLEMEPLNTRYFTKACQLYRDKLKQMAELNEVFHFNRDMLVQLPVAEGKKSIFGVSPNAIFSNEASGPFIRDSEGGRSRGSVQKVFNSSNTTSGNFHSPSDNEGFARVAGTLIEKTKENMSFIGQKLGMF